MTGCSNWRSTLMASLFLGLALPAHGLDGVTFSVQGGDGGIESALRKASLLVPMARGSSDSALEVVTKARAEYAALTDALYALGHYGGVINVRVDGREAADIALLDTPANVSQITVTVNPGPAFTFQTAKISPLPQWARKTEDFVIGAPAKSGVIVDAMDQGIVDWRMIGHAKARVAASTIEADHNIQRVTADITLDAGPKLRFGGLTIEGAESMRPARIAAIAALPEGETFSPTELDLVAQRLRRTGAFRSVVMEEGAQAGADATLPITAVLVEERLRRIAMAANLASLEGLSLGVSGTHRNLFGGAEKLALSAEATRIGVDTGGLDYTLSASFERPATFTPDTTFALGVVFDREQQLQSTNDSLNVTSKLTHYYYNTLTGTGGVAYHVSRAIDPQGTTIFRTLSFPFGLTWDTRNVKKSATDGVYMIGALKPYAGFGAAENGARLSLDARGYRGITPSGNLVLAARVQMGMIIGSSLAGTPREDLFTSGGPSTVRGHPYKSLGLNVLTGTNGATFQTGGTHYLGGSLEARQKLSETIGFVGFLDAGRIDMGGFGAMAGNWHAGAGIGLRYLTAIGPIRVDLAGPVAGTTGNGAQLYIGIGQAF